MMDPLLEDTYNQNHRGRKLLQAKRYVMVMYKLQFVQATQTSIVLVFVPALKGFCAHKDSFQWWILLEFMHSTVIKPGWGVIYNCRLAQGNSHLIFSCERRITTFLLLVSNGAVIHVPKATVFLFVGLHFILRNFKVRRSEMKMFIHRSMVHCYIKFGYHLSCFLLFFFFVWISKIKVWRVM